MTVYKSSAYHHEGVSEQIERVWIASSSLPSATRLAMHQRRLHKAFEADGIRVASVQCVGDAHLLGQPVCSQLPGLFQESSFTSALWAQLAGRSNSAIIGMTWADEYEVLLTRRDELLVGPGCLIGRRLGLFKSEKSERYALRAAALQAYAQTLSFVDMDLSDAQLVDLDVATLAAESRPEAADSVTDSLFDPEADVAVEALRSGLIDVCYLRGPAAHAAERVHRLNVALYVNANKSRNIRLGHATPHVLTVDRAFLDSHPELVARCLAVLLQTAEWAKQHPGEALQLSADSLRVDPRVFTQMYGRSLHRSLTVDLSAYQRRACHLQQAFLRHWGFVDATLDLNEWIDPRPLQAARRLVANGDAVEHRATQHRTLHPRATLSV